MARAATGVKINVPVRHTHLLQYGRPLDLDHEKIGSGLGSLFIACEVLGDYTL
jgi:hypothetical protein